DLSKLPAKAGSLGARYVVVWNFQSGELYEVDRGQLVPRKSYPIPLLNSLEEWGVAPKRSAVMDQARHILEDLALLARGRSLTPYVPDKFYFIGILERAIHDLLPVLQEHIFQQKKDHQIRAQVDAWTAKQGYPIGLPNLDELLARHWAYSLAVRILFYFTVRRYYPALPDLKPPAGRGQPIAHSLWDAFSKAQAVDWQAVFERSPLDELGLPEGAEPILRDLLDDFHRYDFGLLKEDVIGQIMEGLIPEEERHALGQYFTREDLVDFIIGFVARRDDAHYLDPTCGSGTFLTRLYSRLRWLSGYHASHSQLLERVWGVDIAHFPAELATVNLFRQDVRDLTNFPRIIVRDFFGVGPGETFSFPPLKATSPDYPKIQVAIPPFDGIVGNFPYIRQELIERQVKDYKRQIVLAIARQWFWQNPDLFGRRGIREQDVDWVRRLSPDERERWLQTQVQEGRIDLRLSGQADIYAYLFFHAAAFLEEGGRIGIVTSNAWLDVAYGVELKRFFLRHFKIVAVVASWCEPWFEDAAINTAFVILERCEDAEERARNPVRFVKVKKPLAELLPRDLLLQENERWLKVDALVRQIEAADAQVTAWDPATGQVHPLRGVHTVETDDFRIRLVPQGELERELEAKGETAKWGLYIRAPQVYFDILREAGGKLVPLSQVAEVRFGIKTGINDFFYLEPLDEPAQNPGAVRVKNARGWTGEIEEACLRPVVKSPKEAKGLVVDPANLKYRLFLPPVDPASDDPERDLRARFPLAYAYVKWGEMQRTPQGQPWP
ncbi:MAG: HsdM family class I SAM-dependent methyltransferase, partial [Anaerolineae bacterium]